MVAHTLLHFSSKVDSKCKAHSSCIPSCGTHSAESAAFTTDPFCCCSLQPERKTPPWRAPGELKLLHPAPEISAQPPRGMVGHSGLGVSCRESCRGLSCGWKVERLHKPGRHQNTKKNSPVSHQLLFYQHIKCN